ncbi:hypothetical protein QQX13_12170 [Demequina sp. SYSU T00068]|uniref:TA system antitoxin ParD family protein n=1 Tax=Demequina lignilytica TaxID=3051663 RepID=UPI00261932F1|nr:hypothetical protein [Demequina sp. SYSU T00068]MDN4491590.1 hypothetical protein [Demequina sp. SYSU T00068]
MVRESRPTRVPLDVYESAKVAASVTSRTVAQQIAHWVRLGRELELSPQVTYRDVVRVLAGRSSYDALSVDEQALVRRVWAERIAEHTRQLDFADELGRTGAQYSEFDAEGVVPAEDRDSGARPPDSLGRGRPQ